MNLEVHIWYPPPLIQVFEHLQVQRPLSDTLPAEEICLRIYFAWNVHGLQGRNIKCLAKNRIRYTFLAPTRLQVFP